MKEMMPKRRRMMRRFLTLPLNSVQGLRGFISMFPKREAITTMWSEFEMIIV
jgi:hypothetical protein